MEPIYALEILLIRIFVRPFFCLFERITGFAALNGSLALALTHLGFSLLFMGIATSYADDFKGNTDLIRAGIAFVGLFSVYYSGHMMSVTYHRFNLYYHSRDGWVPSTSKVMRDPKRVFWCLVSIVCLFAIYKYAQRMPLLFFLLSPLCVFGPILILCGMRPYHEASEEAQAVKRKKEFVTMSIGILSSFLMATWVLHPGGSEEKFLLSISGVALYWLIMSIARQQRKRP